MKRAVIVLPLAALALTACDVFSGDQKGDDSRKAGGEVLGGSISDEMIPLDTLTSQSPPMKHQAVSDDADAGTGDAEAPVEGAEEAAAEPSAETPAAPVEPAAE